MSVLSSKKAFSHIELLVTVGVVGVLSAIAIPSYQKYKLSVLQAEQKKELIQVAKVLEYAHVTDGGYHQKIYAAGYRPQKVMKFNVGLDYDPTTEDICCDKYPTIAEITTDNTKLDGFLSLTKKIYSNTSGNLDIWSELLSVCLNYPVCEIEGDPIKISIGGAFVSPPAHGSNSGHDSQCNVFVGSTGAAKCNCDEFVVMSRLDSGGKSYSAYINHEGIICKADGSGTSAPLSQF